MHCRMKSEVLKNKCMTLSLDVGHILQSSIIETKQTILTTDFCRGTTCCRTVTPCMEPEKAGLNTTNSHWCSVLRGDVYFAAAPSLSDLDATTAGGSGLKTLSMFE